MTPEQIALVQRTFALLRPTDETMVALFYKQLFILDPVLRMLFPCDMHAQERKLMMMLGMAVNSLSRLETLVPTVQELGRRHNSYGVTDTDYETVGVALMGALHHLLREQWTLEIEEAWAAVYALLAETMKAACAKSLVS